MINRFGVREIFEIKLNESEKQKFALSCNIIREMLDEINV